MKRLLMLTLIICMSLFTYAQKVDLGESYAKVQYRNLPAKPLGMDYKTFSVETHFSKEIAKNVTVKEAVDSIVIEGYKRTSLPGDLIVKFYVEDFQQKRIEVMTRVDVAQDYRGGTEGRISANKYNYWFEVDYNFTARVEFFDNRTKQTIETQNLDFPMTLYTFKSPEYKAFNIAQNAYDLHKDKVVDNIIKGKMHLYYATIKSNLSRNYGYPVVEENVLIWNNESKKHPEFESYAKADVAMKQAYATLNPNVSVDQAKVIFQPAIDYFNGLLQKYTGDKKADKKLRYAAYFNLGRIYLNLDMPDEAIKMGEALIANDYEAKDGKIIIKEALDLKAMFATNNFNTRHFDRGL